MEAIALVPPFSDRERQVVNFDQASQKVSLQKTDNRWLLENTKRCKSQAKSEIV